MLEDAHPVDELPHVADVANSLRLPASVRSHFKACRRPEAAERNNRMDQQVHRVSVEIGGTQIEFETGKLAKQASGAVLVKAGDTHVLATATAGNERDVDFLPLTVDVEDRSSRRVGAARRSWSPCRSRWTTSTPTTSSR